MVHWEYNLLSFNTASYTEEIVEAELNKLGKAGWEAVSMVMLMNGWLRVLLKRKTK